MPRAIRRLLLAAAVVAVAGCGSAKTRTIEPGPTEQFIRENVHRIGHGIPGGPITCPSGVKMTTGATIPCKVVLLAPRTLAQTYGTLVVHVASGGKLVFREQDLRVERVLHSYAGFATVIPRGFKDASGELPVDVFSAPTPSSPSLDADAGPRMGGVPAAIALVRVPAQGVDPGDVERAFKRQDPHASRFSPLRPLTVAGEPADSFDYYTSGTLRAPPHRRVTLRRLVIAVSHEDSLYLIGYSTAPSAYKAHLDAVKQVIRAWRWD